ncbi:helix-turn-helix domain-containing protein [Chitinophaga sancti]|uniref:Helix-turn-helix domain-containing protein n=1 Tax=Chitinophaga sancti TaxID=1004 RepID=A0A1K1SXB1_9BACT|nr:helix-turn-helix domain-containing protein [Chitinophaga sancti]WQD62278.1 helix-turn-helix transcriptional regulator [Chitinophaga sancti]WQG92153.1 helix-turn-helix transcriptional regulator [Chitinophaga sancti]SFW88962.1 Helix-turn-helix domain-containing protein [Chitinophaga sancti]
MNENQKGLLFDTLADQYRYNNLPTDLIHLNSEFTIFNLADLHQPMPFSLPLSRLNFFVFGFIKEARGSYTLDHHTFDFKPNTIYFTNPGHYRSFRHDEIKEAYLITFSESFLRESIHGNIFDEFPFLLTETVPAKTVTPEVFNQFERLYLQIHQEYTGQSPFRKKIIISLFFALLLKYKEYFFMDYSPIYEGNRGSEIVVNFKKLLDKHYRELANGSANEVFRLQDYADAQNLHPNYLGNVIKAKTGKTIGMWISEKSVAESRSLLQNTSLPVKDIAYRLGFTDTAHFSKFFKKQLGISPVVYRKTPQF